MWETRAKHKAQIKELQDVLEKLTDRFEEEVERASRAQVSDVEAINRRHVQRFDTFAESLGISPKAGGDTAVAKSRARQDDVDDLSDDLREAERENLRLKRKYGF